LVFQHILVVEALERELHVFEGRSRLEGDASGGQAPRILFEELDYFSEGLFGVSSCHCFHYSVTE